MTKDEALKLSLEALIGARAFLESDAPVEIWSVNDKAITAIKQAFAQHDSVQAKPEPEQWGASAVTQPEYVAEQKRKTEELRSMLAQTQEPTNIERHEANVQKFLGAPQPEQEPVAWPCLIAEADFSENTVILAMQCTDYKVSAGNHWLSNIPPQRTWVGLTDEDWDEIFGNALTIGEAIKATETKLKEKNI